MIITHISVSGKECRLGIHKESWQCYCCKGWLEVDQCKT